MEKGYIHIYTGNGKGKTTASLGVAFRAIGNGMKVAIGQFIKSKGVRYNESNAIQLINNIGSPLGSIHIEQFGEGCCIHGCPADTDKAGALKGWDKVKEWIFSEEYDVVILDELNIALHLKLIPIEEVIDVLTKKPEKMEIIITGRHAPQELIDFADLVTEMKEIKHYYRQGVLAREGIDR